MKKRTVFLIEIIAAILLVALDYITKQLAVAKLMGKNAFVIIKGVFELDYLQNYGTAFGMFQNKRFMILVVGVIFMAVVLWALYKIPAEKKYAAMHICLLGILAGGIGNMIDRFFYGYVIDFFSFCLIHFPVFNVADCYITVSVFLLLILFFFVYKEEDLEFLSFKKKSEK